jgi:chloramphenicol-sensitive protein RarD
MSLLNGSDAGPLDRGGLSAALGAYVLWGVFPLYWFFLKHLPALQIIAHRVIWCALFVIGWLLLKSGAEGFRRALATPRVLPLLLASSVLITVNWGLYIWAVTNGHVVQSSLGYFINPLVNVALGVVVFGERLNPRQWTSVGLAAAGVLWLTVQQGGLPWIALSLALSFACYGLIRKVAAVESVQGLGIESAFLLLPALLVVAFAWGADAAHTAWQLTGREWVLLIIGGGLTALPLIGFAYGARRIPYSLMGVLQYLSPTLQLICGVLLLGEPFTATQALGFSLIWLALLVYAGDGIWRARQRVLVTVS